MAAPLPPKNLACVPVVGLTLFVGLMLSAGSLTADDERGISNSATPIDPTQVIDQHVAVQWAERHIAASDRVGDAAFARRLYLDLVGRIPTPEEISRFVVDESADKRAALVDRLLANVEFARHMADVFDVVLMGREQGGRSRIEPDRHWREYLARTFAENRPYDQFVRDLLLARPDEERDRGAVWYQYSRKNEHQAIAEAVAANLFGVQIDCAQCHDHPLAEEILQADYWGLVAFFNRGKNVQTDRGPRIAESAIGGFAQFTDLSGNSNSAELMFLGTEVTGTQPRPKDGEKQDDLDGYYITADAQGNALQPRLPKYSRRQKLADEIVAGNSLIARALVNRMWALLMGRGIVHPVDKMDSMHEPSHPQLLDVLAKDFQQHGYDIQRLVRTIVLSKPYQLDSRPAGDASDDSTFAWGLAKPLSAEQLYRSMLIAVYGSLKREDEATLNEFRKVFPDLFAEENISNVKQSLFLTNNPAMQEVFGDANSKVYQQMQASESLNERVRIAFDRAFARSPDDDELLACIDYLHSHDDQPQPAAQHLLWSLLTSAEFRMNH